MGQQKLKEFSEQYMKIVNQAPPPEDLSTERFAETPIPMAVESFVSSLGVSLTEEQKSQLHGLLKRPSTEGEDPTKRRKTDSPASPSPVELQGVLAPIPLTILTRHQRRTPLNQLSTKGLPCCLHWLSSSARSNF